MVNKILEALQGIKLNSELIEPGYLIRPTAFPSVTFHFYGRGTKIHGDGTTKAKGGYLQIDIWTQSITGIDALVDDITVKIHSNILVGTPTREDTLDPTDKVYHTILKFEFLEGR